jgi:hypothetical protein
MKYNYEVNQIGLFGYIESVQIKNLGVEIAKDKEIKDDIGVGGIAGYIYNSNITNSYFAGNVDGNSYIGGIGGFLT